jgi:hypothetical protein
MNAIHDLGGTPRNYYIPSGQIWPAVLDRTMIASVRTRSNRLMVLSLAGALALTARFGHAQTPVSGEGPGSGSGSAAGPKLSGFVDTTYNYNVNRPASGKNTYFSYDARHNNFSLNTADVALSGGAADGFSYYVQVDMGANAALDGAGYDATIFDVQEAYAQYESKDKWGIKVGKFVTYNGIEVIESPSDPTISRGYLFGFAEPFTHIGAVVTYRASGTVDFAIGAINGWDLLADTNKFKMVVAKLGLNFGDPLGLTISSYAGPDQAGNNDHWRATFDVTGVSKHGNTTINFQGNYGFEQKVTMAGEDDSWFGFGIQPVFKLDDRLSLGVRGEMFRDDKGSRGVLPQALLFNVTVAPAFSLTPSLVLRAEARLDASNKDAFDAHDGTAKNNQIVGMAEALAAF